MNVREVLRRLARDGRLVGRTRGDHRQLKHPAKAGSVMVVVHPNDDIHSQDPGEHLATSPIGGRAVREYTVLYEHGGRNWSAYVPDLPGCVATGKTREETEQRIRDAIAFHIEGLKSDGEPIPEPTIEAGILAVPT